MLFILAMEPLQRLFELATQMEVLTPLNSRIARLRASFYADDAALFINPHKNDITAVQRILQLFGDASGLKTNIAKCVAYPVACEGEDLGNILQDFGGTHGFFHVNIWGCHWVSGNQGKLMCNHCLTVLSAGLEAGKES
jgi:hypothetical protein